MLFMAISVIKPRKLTYIQITEDQKQLLVKNKIHPREPYREVLERLLEKRSG